MAQVAAELGIPTSGINLNQANVRSLAGKASGQISMSDLWGKSSVVKDSITIGQAYAWANSYPHPHVSGTVYGFATNTSARFSAMSWLAITNQTFGSASGTSALGNIVGFGCFDYDFYPPQYQNPQGGGYTLTLTFASAPGNSSVTVKLGSLTYTLSKLSADARCYSYIMSAAEYNAFPKSGRYDLIVS